MSYVKESAASTARRRRHRRAAITLTLSVLLLVGAFGYAVAYYQRWIGSEASATPQCTPSASVSATEDPLAHDNIRLNVYNATGRSGLAGETARSLRDRGFTVDVVSNDPLHQTVDGTAQIRYGKAGTQAARKVVAKQVKGAHLVRDARTDASVDVVIGAKFRGLAAPEKTPATSEPTLVPGC